eukprot:GHVU01131734.1.p1 GENE.GHVU01131734.1~~GHVU01131734.1.p1  ORF type:complete len:386 (-),score=71.11 GHVU01131734.1:87-1160(-)
MGDRSREVARAMDGLEHSLQLLALTGVEDKLQEDVPATVESLRHAGVRVWMLTGDKIETAQCVAISAGLKGRHQGVKTLNSKELDGAEAVLHELERFGEGPPDTVLTLDGAVLQICLASFPSEFINIAAMAPAVICCRCSPTQKAAVVRLIKEVTGTRTCAIGDGGNDVSMILEADVGVGIVGKEGKQASLAADYSVPSFCYARRLLLWHGRNAYQRSAKLAQFVVHRGLIIATIQTIFSLIFYCIPLSIFQGWLIVGYATYYTMAPVFALVLDLQLPEEIVFLFPELYNSLRTGRIMSTKTFFGWVWLSVYQGTVIMLGPCSCSSRSSLTSSPSPSHRSSSLNSSTALPKSPRGTL